MACNGARPDSLWSRVFARVYDPVMSNLEEKVLWHHRLKLITPLTGNILEVGAGTGVNFKFYNPSAKVLACEPSEAMCTQALSRAADLKLLNQITVVQAGIGDELLSGQVPAEGFDAIVFTLVLCTIPDPKLAIETVKRWLKPNGKLVVLEHVVPDHWFRKGVHRAINPVWNRVAEGCDLCRDTEKLLREGGFRTVEDESFTAGVPFYKAVLVRA